MMNRYIPLLLALLLFVPSGAFAQDSAPEADAMQRLSGGFQVLMGRTDASKRAGASGLPLILQKTALEDEAGEVRYPAIIRTSDAAALRRAGIPVNSVLGSIVTARLTAEDIRTAAGISSIQRIQPAAIASLHNDEAAREVGARILNSGAVNGTNYSGQGVLTCIVDSGLDADHGDFLDANGDTRVVYLWDQTNATVGQTPQDRSGTMTGLDYGTEYSAADIDAGSVSQEDTDGHGTHVAGTVASSGNALVLSGSQTTPEHRGMAPEADIIVVKAGNGSFPTTNIVDAMSYCGQVATDQNQPLVINMSLGSDLGAHDGTSSLDLAVDAFTDATPNDGSNDPGTAPDRVVVVSAGNDGASAQHVTGTIAGGNTASEPWTVGEYLPSDGIVNDYVGIQKWFDTADDVTITVTAPNGTDSVTLTGSGTTVDDLLAETPSGSILLESGIGPDNGDRYFDIQIYDYEDTSVDPAEEITPAEGEWQIEIENLGSSAVTYHGWTWGVTVPGSFNNGDGNYTIGTPGTSTGAITVGSHAHRWYWGTNGGVYAYASGFSDRNDISFFSSRGPRRDGVVKPDLTAPGQAMVSAYSQDMPELGSGAVFDQDGMHRYSQGTSMSSPVVAGAVALLLQAAEQEGTALTANEVRSYLTSNADTDGFTAQYGAVPNAEFGYGKLDILDAVVDFLGGTTSRELIADYDDVAFSDMSRLDITAATPRIAVRFQPTVNGHVSGSLLRLWHDFGSPGGSAIELTGPLNVEVWSDDGSGVPDAKIGNRVAVPAEQLFPFTPNAFDLQAADVKVTAGTEYHLVLSASNASDALYLSGETASGAGRTSVFDGTSWSQASADLQASIEVARIFGITTSLPVELAVFDGRPVDDAVELTWTTTAETNNDGFYVERRPGNASASAAWTTLGFVQGAGTTTESQRYRFTDANLPFGHSEMSYRLRQVDVDGTPTYSTSRTIRLTAPGEVTLHAPFPNPAQRDATLRYELPEDGPVRIQLFDVLGRRVLTVLDATETRGEKSVTLSTDRLAPGLYFVRLEAGDTIRTQRMSVVR
ncbi:MAG: S8 family serine peptidase [Bacteroidetes bacterium]|jgi:subtilisin family serine protease|nr:S8 family serine peptidase [Bacteroidota bacterium]